MAPNNVLVLGSPKSGKIRIAQYLSGDYGTETISPESHSGLVYSCDLTTRYFKLSVNLLIEEFPDERSSDNDPVQCLETWFSEFSTPEFQELRDALDGVVYTVAMEGLHSGSVEAQLDVLGRIKTLLDDDAFVVVVGCADSDVPDHTADQYEDLAISSGFEFVNLQKSGTNEYMEKQGKERLLEIFHTHLWSDMDTLAHPEQQNHRREKVAGMAQGLLEVDENDKQIDFERVLEKLRVDKEKVLALQEHEKREYVDQLVEEYLEYL